VADPRPPTLVVGIGNPDRGDDGAGCLVARRLAAMTIPGVRVLEHRSEASSLLPHLEEVARAFLVDASVSGRQAGAIQRFDVSAHALPAIVRTTSSHGIGLGEVIELARMLGRLPGECVVYAIEAGRCEAGMPPTPEVEEAIHKVAARLMSDLSA
jgi:hydrogenase maturation protease